LLLLSRRTFNLALEHGRPSGRSGSTAGHSTLSFLCFPSSLHGHPRALHSFPTRRSSDLFVPVDQPFPFSDDQRLFLFLFPQQPGDRKSTRLNSSHVKISYAVFCLKKKTNSASLLPALRISVALSRPPRLESRRTVVAGAT